MLAWHCREEVHCPQPTTTLQMPLLHQESLEATMQVKLVACWRLQHHVGMLEELCQQLELQLTLSLDWQQVSLARPALAQLWYDPSQLYLVGHQGLRQDLLLGAKLSSGSSAEGHMQGLALLWLMCLPQFGLLSPCFLLLPALLPGGL